MSVKYRKIQTRETAAPYNPEPSKNVNTMDLSMSTEMEMHPGVSYKNVNCKLQFFKMQNRTLPSFYFQE